MPILLRVDSSPMLQSSVSRRLTEVFVHRWRALRPDGRVVSRDLNQTDMAPVTTDWIAAAYTPEESLSPKQKQILELSDALVAELEAADEYVIGVPMHNFSIPSTAKLWIDLIARRGKTFTYAEGRQKDCCWERRPLFSSLPEVNMTPEPLWPHSTSSNLISAQSSHFSASRRPLSSMPAEPPDSDPRKLIALRSWSPT